VVKQFLASTKLICPQHGSFRQDPDPGNSFPEILPPAVRLLPPEVNGLSSSNGPPDWERCSATTGGTGAGILFKERFFAINGWPFRHERFAARTSTTGKTSLRPAENVRNFLGNALLPKSQARQSFDSGTHLVNDELI